MDELGFNKIAGAILATALGVMVLRTAPHIFIHSEMPSTPAYRVGPLEVASKDDAEPLPFPQLVWVDAMDSTRGLKVFKKCTSCHNADIDGAHGTGPNLWNVVGSTAGVKDGFKYSNALVTSGKTWTYEELDGFLAKPTKYISGTNMNFVGLKKETDRAAVIELLRQASASPLSKPAPKLVENESSAEADAVSQGLGLETKEKKHGDEAH